MKIHAAPPSPRAFKVLAVARQLGLDFELVPVDLLNGANQRPVFVALNPNKKMPVLEEDGFVLWESNASIQYRASKKPESGLLPSAIHAAVPRSRGGNSGRTPTGIRLAARCSSSIS